MFISVYANREDNGEDKGEDKQGPRVSVYMFLMTGDNDDNLKWPFKGTVEVSLLNQLEDGQHLTRQLWSATDDTPEQIGTRVVAGEKSSGWGFRKFIAHSDLGYHDDKNRQFLKDDTLFFRVECFEPELD